MKIIGMILIVLSAVSVGIRTSAELKNNCRKIQELINLLQMMSSELTFTSNALLQVFERVAEHTQYYKSVIEVVVTEMKSSCWVTPHSAFEKALAKHPDCLTGELLLDLSGSLGKYDLDAQLRGIENAQRKAKQMLETMQAECGIKSKTYKALSISAGLAAIILLA